MSEPTLSDEQTKILRALYASVPCCGCCNGDDDYRQQTIRDVIMAMGHPVEMIKVRIPPLQVTFAVPDLDLEPDDIADLFGRHLIEAEGDVLSLGEEVAK
jgi:hypothetical protein